MWSTWNNELNNVISLIVKLGNYHINIIWALNVSHSKAQIIPQIIKLDFIIKGEIELGPTC